MFDLRACPCLGGSIRSVPTCTLKTVARLGGTEMRRVFVVSVVAGLIGAIAPGAAAGAAEEDRRHDVIVQTTIPMSDTALARLGITADQLETRFDEVFDGVTVAVTDSELARLDALPGVEIEEVVELAPAETTLQEPAPWHLSRLDQKAGFDYAFTYPSTAGSGVRIYVVDTGVEPSSQFSGRLTAGVNISGDGGTSDDCDGHGTHVAGIAASSTYGVAKKSTVVPVRVFDCSSGTTSSSRVINALEWIAQTHANGAPGVVNLSLAGPRSGALNDAVTALVGKGLVVVAAAGNASTDACLESPASAPAALTVGATTSGDAKASFSNFGSCLDLFAPGSGVTSTYIDNRVGQMSGTSMAAPVVAGVAALAWGNEPGSSGAAISSRVIFGAVGGIVTSPGTGSPNRLANIEALSYFGASTPSAPRSLKVTANTLSSINLDWVAPAEDGGAPLTDYVVQYRKTSWSSWSTLPDPVRTASYHTFRNPPAGVDLEFRVTAINGVGSGGWASVTVRSAARTPSAPGPVSITRNDGRALVLAWGAPASSGAAAITDYVVQMRRVGSSSWTMISDGVSTRRSAIIWRPPQGAKVELRVRAKNAYGAGASSATSVVVKTRAPSAPTELATTRNTTRALTVSWAAPEWGGASTISGYVVQYRKAGSSTWTSVSKSADARSHTIWSPPLDTTVSIRVSARNADGRGASAGLAVATATAAPSAVGDLSASLSGSVLVLNWSAPSSSGAGAVTDYRVVTRPLGASQWTVVEDGVSTATSAVVAAPASGTGIEVRVTASNDFRTGPAAGLTYERPL